MNEFVFRFLVGGCVVSFFAMVGGALKPKSFAGLFAAAPSVALATIGLTVLKKGTGYATTELHSMILGATAFLIYAWLVSRVLFRGTFPVVPTTTIALPAIFPASASLIQKHQRERKEKAGLDGMKRGRTAAAIDAFGAAIGCLGLALFATTAWKILPHGPLWLTLTVATLVWAISAVAGWFTQRHLRRQRSF